MDKVKSATSAGGAGSGRVAENSGKYG